MATEQTRVQRHLLQKRGDSPGPSKGIINETKENIA
jgi:hypothetical protein